MKNKFLKIFVVALALMSFIILSILPASAATAEDFLDDTYKYYVVYNSTVGQLIAVSQKPAYANYDGQYYSLSVSYNSTYIYYLSSGEQYDFIGSSGTLVFTKNSNFVVSSNYDIHYFESSEVFFQQPTLLKQLLNPVQKQVGEKITAYLGTLTVCGIGCLALLIGLSLFPKVLYKFL